jgi:L-ascorbate metabolism protein UlaG (beta-lactamase superfamily)/NAD(P)-dependent dehydrogenase (short-subunit alcohol dehydrogenase family)
MALPALGARASGDRLERMRQSPQWRDGHFQDVVPRGAPSVYAWLRRQIGWDALSEWAFGGSEHRVPKTPVPVITPTGRDFQVAPATALRVTWLGHSTLLVEIDGMRVLIDPVWAKRVGPSELLGQRRFFAPPLAFEELPELDVVLISHDHYDHLDYPTILRLAKTRASFVVPLGVGAHLEAWGIAPERITELDWWEERRIGELSFVATPARHFSGRGVLDLEQTLWASWAILGPSHRVFYSGDTAMFPGLAEIGERFGPFDVTLIETGGYSRHWTDVHLGPEQAVEAHHMLRGKVMVPVHWGLFDLAMHGWTEPIERVLAAARVRGTRVATPRLGESFEPEIELPSERWWPDLPWQTAEESPVVTNDVRSVPVLPPSTGRSRAETRPATDDAKRRLTNRTVLITGGARGIGFELAKLCAADDATVLLVDISEPHVAHAVEVLSAQGAKVHGFVHDVTDRTGCYALADRIEEEIGPVHMLINNAGVVRKGDFLEGDDEGWSSTLNVNLHGLMYMMRAFMPRMIERRDGLVVNMSSILGYLPAGGAAAYCATKHAVVGLTEAVRSELMERGVKGVDLILACPGFTDTGMFAGVRTPRLFGAVSPSATARAIYGAMNRRWTAVVFPYWFFFLPILYAMTPRRVWLWMTRLFGVHRAMDGHIPIPDRDSIRAPAPTAALPANAGSMGAGRMVSEPPTAGALIRYSRASS